MELIPRIWKKLALVTFIVFICMNGVSMSAGHSVGMNKSEPVSGGVFGLSSRILVSWDANETEEPIMPRGPLRVVDLEISFGVTYGVLGRLVYFLFRSNPVKITLDVDDTPDWCIATLSQKELQCTIPAREDSYEIVHTMCSVQVSDEAPAFAPCPIKIRTTVQPFYGPFGFLSFLQGATREDTVTFTVAYKPLISPLFPETNVIEAPPFVEVQLPIWIKNLGNGRTTVVNEIMNYPDGWIVSLPDQLIVDVDVYGKMNLSILPTWPYIGEKTITLSFTPHSSDDFSLYGDTTFVTIVAYFDIPQ
jgi:hypothetical protein